MWTKILTMIIVINLIDIGISKPASGTSEENRQLPEKKNSSIRLKLDKPGVKYGDHYLCRAERIEERRYLTEIAPVKSWGANHKSSLHACPRPTVEEHGAVWPCGEMSASLFDRDHEHYAVCHPEYDGLVLYEFGDEQGDEVGTPLKLPQGVSFEVGEGTKYPYLVVKVYYGNSMYYFSGGMTVYGDDDLPGITYLYQTEPTRYEAGVMLLINDGVLRPNSDMPENENVLDVVCDPTSMHRHTSVIAFAYRVHAHSRGVLISGFRLRGSVNQEWTLIGSRSPQEEQRYYPISNPLQIRPDDCLIARCQYDNPTNETIMLASRREREMCRFHIMYYMERPVAHANETSEERFWENFCVAFSPIRITDMSDYLGDIPKWVEEVSLKKVN